MDTNRTTANAAIDSSAVHRIEFDVDWPPGFVSAYLLDGEEPVLVDAGATGADNERALRDGLAEAGLRPADVAHVVVTHPHDDHVGFVEPLREAGDPTVYAPATYRETLSRPLSELKAEMATTVREAGLWTETVDEVVEEALGRTAMVREMLPAESVDVWVEDGETVTLGERAFEAILTPGHQRDHLCFEAALGDAGNAERALFSGDMAIRTFRAVAVHAGFLPEQKAAVAAYERGLDRLSGRDVDRVYPGHGPAHAELDAALETAREGLERLREGTAAAIRESGTHAVGVASERSESLSDGPWIPEAIAGLATLEREGRAESYLEDGVRYYLPT